MAERFFAIPVKLDSASEFMTELQGNKGVVKDTITTTPVSSKVFVITYYNDIPVVAKADGATTTYEGGDAEPTWADLVEVTDGDHASEPTLTIYTDNVDMSTVGTFVVTYIATDASGNASDPFELTITIEDTTAPTIIDAETLVVSYVTGSEVPATWLTGITATDLVDGDVTSSIVVTDTAVDMVTVGTFAILYDVDDAEGNSATQLSKTITITAE